MQSVRLVPGVLGHEGSVKEESFSLGGTAADDGSSCAAELLEYPQYTRPRVFRGMAVPQVLVSGNHEEVRRWRAAEALRRTAGRRPDLLAAQKTEDDSEARRNE